MRAPDQPSDRRRLFRISRLFSVVSLACVLTTAVALAYFYRYVAVNAVIDLGEQNNVVLAQAALNATRSELSRFLKQVPAGKILSPDELPPVPHELAAALRASINNTSVVRIKIYDRRGLVVFSTKPSQVGQQQGENRGFRTALEGGVKSKLIYRDTFNVFDRVTEEDNLMQTYIPVRELSWEPILGVFEIYTDMNPLVHKIEKTELLIMFWVGAILLLLYILLIMVVRRSETIIDRQNDTILERTRTLELLSARMLSAEEGERRKIAFQLHEGIAQALSAIKLRIEQVAGSRTEDPATTEIAGSCQLVVPEIQRAIQQVRAMAMDLHPSSLDDFGLLPTISWLTNELASIYPTMRIDTVAEVQESEIPDALKPILFRVVQEALGRIAERSQPTNVRITLAGAGHGVSLEIRDNGTLAPTEESGMERRSQEDAELASIRQRVILSGGNIYLDEPGEEGNTLRASWGV